MYPEDLWYYLCSLDSHSLAFLHQPGPGWTIGVLAEAFLFLVWYLTDQLHTQRHFCGTRHFFLTCCKTATAPVTCLFMVARASGKQSFCFGTIVTVVCTLCPYRLPDFFLAASALCVSQESSTEPLTNPGHMLEYMFHAGINKSRWKLCNHHIACFGCVCVCVSEHYATHHTSHTGPVSTTWLIRKLNDSVFFSIRSAIRKRYFAHLFLVTLTFC